MNEQSKSAKRRYYDGNFHNRFFVGKGIDIGGGKDCLSQYTEIFPRMKSVLAWDKQDGDAELMEGVPNKAYNFVHSSHCLEHLSDVTEALTNWIRILKVKGHLIVTVPEEDMYEAQTWPSKYNKEHKHTFTMMKRKSWSPVSINVIDLCRKFSNKVSIEKVQLVHDFFTVRDQRRGKNQTGTPNAECSIEFIWKKL